MSRTAPPRRQSPDAASRRRRGSPGFGLIELMVAMALGLVLIAGAVEIQQRGSAAWRAADSLARLQETAAFALDALEADLRLAGYFGLSSLPPSAPAGLDVQCAGGGPAVGQWAFRAVPVEAVDDIYDLPCPPFATARAGSDVLVLRHAMPAPAAPESGRVQLQSTLRAARLFANGNPPVTGTDPESLVSDYMVHGWYVSEGSSFEAGRPSLRRLTLKKNLIVGDDEVIPGVENLQLQFGLDTDGDGSVDRYVDPDHPAVEPDAVPLAVRAWLLAGVPANDSGWRQQQAWRSFDRDLGDIHVPAEAGGRIRRLAFTRTWQLRNVAP